MGCFPSYRASTAGLVRATDSPDECAFTIPFTERVTVNVWGLLLPLMLVTVTSSPPIVIGIDTLPVCHSVPLGVATDRLVPLLVTPLASVEMSASNRDVSSLTT